MTPRPYIRCRACKLAQSRHTLTPEGYRCPDGMPTAGEVASAWYEQETGATSRIGMSWSPGEVDCLRELVRMANRSGDLRVIRHPRFQDVAGKVLRMAEKAEGKDAAA